MLGTLRRLRAEGCCEREARVGYAVTLSQSGLDRDLSQKNTMIMVVVIIHTFRHTFTYLHAHELSLHLQCPRSPTAPCPLDSKRVPISTF